jgi:hypothetical protein
MSGRAVAALVFALAGLICCPLTSPLACWLGWLEAAAAKRGESPPENAAVAWISFWLGVVGTLLGVLFLLALLVVGAAVALLPLFSP